MRNTTPSKPTNTPPSLKNALIYKASSNKKIPTSKLSSKAKHRNTTHLLNRKINR